MTSPFLFLTLGFLIISVGALWAFVIISADDNPQIQANQDNISFLIETDKIILEAQGKTINRSANNTDKITALQNYDETITKQIGDIKADIKSKFPQASDVIDKEKSSISTTPFLTLRMDKTDYFLGNVVFFMGTAVPNDPVFITLKDPDRGLFQIPISRNQIIDGSYMTNYTLRLDDPIGTWQVYARQLSDQTKTLTFAVE